MRRKVKLSELYKEIGKYLDANGDADVVSIATHCNSAKHIQYTLELCDLKNDSFDVIGKISVKYEEI